MHVISIVDGDESLRRAVSDLLTSVGFGVETFASDSFRSEGGSVPETNNRPPDTPGHA